MKDISPEKFNSLSDSKAKKSPLLKDCIFAFLIGGIFCAIGEILSQLYISLGLSKDLSSALVSISLVVLSAILTALNLYDKIAKVGGAGTLVPITGFANSIVAPAMEFVPEGWILGVGVKIFSIAGPVLAYGGIASFIAGVIYYFLEVIK